MRKLILLGAILLTTHLLNAQVRRVTTKKDSDSSGVAKSPKPKMDRKAMLLNLDLTKEQRGKLKELNSEQKAQKEAIQNDDTLSEQDKALKLKELRKAQVTKMQAILTREQWEKLKDMRKQADKTATF